jgi:small-conductance mechanosensitive channel
MKLEFLNLDFLDQVVLGSSLLQWMLAVSATVATVLVLWIARGLASRRLAALAPRTDTRVDDVAAELIGRTRVLVLLVAGLFIGSLFLQLPDRVESILSSVLVIVLLVQIGIWGAVLLNVFMDNYRRRALERNPAAAASIGVLAVVARIILWSIVILLSLDNLGIDVTALVAGLGIGGVAVALAVQNILGDLFASLSIMLDKPFTIGDFLIIDDYLGSVEYVGLKTTRIRSLSGEQLIFSNSDLLKSRIRNYGRMYERRVVLKIGVTYETPREKLVRIPGIIREAVEAQDRTRFDRSHFMKYDDYALQFETVFYIGSPDYNIYMDIQQAILFLIHERFEAEQIQFAYPAQRVFLTRAEAKA